VFRVCYASETAQVELRSGRVSTFEGRVGWISVDASDKNGSDSAEKWTSGRVSLLYRNPGAYTRSR